MGINENDTASADNVQEGLGIIKGIGPKFAEALSQIGIRRVADLADYTPDTLSEALLNRAGVKVSPERIEANDWIGQARELAEVAKEESTPPEPDLITVNKPDATWNEHAYFSLKFEYMNDEDGQKSWQTHIYREQDGGEAVEFPGIDDSATWVDWILERAKLPDLAKLPPTGSEVGAPAETEATILPTPVTQEYVRIKILDVQLSEARPRSALAEKHLVSEVHFQVLGAQVEMNTAESYPLQIEVQTINLESDASNLVASEDDQIQPQTYRKTQQFPIPEVGHYELQSQVALLLPNGKVSDVHKGPRFRVKA